MMSHAQRFGAGVDTPVSRDAKAVDAKRYTPLRRRELPETGVMRDYFVDLARKELSIINAENKGHQIDGEAADRFVHERSQGLYAMSPGALMREIEQLNDRAQRLGLEILFH